MIPRAMRKASKIHPGSKILFTLERDRAIVRKQELELVAIFERIAKKVKPVKHFTFHAYEESEQRE